MSFKKIFDGVLKIAGSLLDVDGIIKDVAKKVEKQLINVVDEVRERLISSLLEIFAYVTFLVLFVMAIVTFAAEYLPEYAVYAILAMVALSFGLLISRGRESQDKQKK